MKRSVSESSTQEPNLEQTSLVQFLLSKILSLGTNKMSKLNIIWLRNPDLQTQQRSCAF